VQSELDRGSTLGRWPLQSESPFPPSGFVRPECPMPLRYLSGPVSGPSCPLPRAAADGRCTFFSRQDLQRAGSWQALCAQGPGWRPDLVVLQLAYQTLPTWLWEAPVPLVGLAAEAQLQWHWYRRVLPRCEAVLADAPTVERLHRQGISQTGVAVVFGLDPAFLKTPVVEIQR